MIITARSSKILAAQFIIIKKRTKSTKIRELTYQEISPSAANDNNEFGEITVPYCAVIPDLCLLK